MLTHAQLKCGVVALLGLMACSEGPPPTAGVSLATSPAVVETNDPSQSVALGIAHALANPSVRVALLKALRESPWVEHKLVLQEFIATPRGAVLAVAAAQARGMSAAAFVAQVNALPLLDFYVSSRADRLRWKGDGALGVALSTASAAAPPFAYTPDGAAIPYASARDGGRVVVVLHPAEAKGRPMQKILRAQDG